MKSKSTAKKIMSLILSVLMIATCFAAFPFEAFAVYTKEVSFPRADDPCFSYEGFGLQSGTCVTGNSYTISVRNPLFTLDGYSKLAYCIELGTSVDPNANINTTDEDAACATIAANLRDEKNVTQVNMSGAQMKKLLRSVLGYGYHHNGGNITKWDNLLNNSDHRYRYCYAYATQILVRELVSGERDADFNHLTVPAGYVSIYDHSVKSNNPLKADIDKYYRQIEENVKNATPNLDPSIKDATFTMQVNDATKTVEVSIPDVNGLFASTNAIEGIQGASFVHDGSALHISVPYRYAKEGTYKLNYTINSCEPDVVEIYLPSNSQDMVAAATGEMNIVSTSGTVTLVIPHHHEWVPHVIAPTCTTQGQTCMMCKCGDIKTVSTTAHLDHDYANSAWVVGQLATCTEDGELVQICERCNTVIDTKPIPATGHNGVWIIATEATADHAGQQVKCCTVCGNKTETRTYSRHTHELGYEAVVREATCANEGLKGSFCKYCLACFSTTSIPAGHSDSVTWVTTTQPTCTEAGESSAFCGDCGIILSTKTIDATGHASGVWMTSIAPFCGLEGEDICVCDQCGETIDSRATQALSHDEGVWKTTKDPTCEFEGERAKSCTRCGQITETESIAALGHDDGVWRIDFEATADHDGQMGRYCTRCSMVLETSVFTLHDHETGYSKTLLQPTCTADGETGIICGICNAVYLSEIIPALGHEYSAFYTQSNGTHSKSCSRCHYEYTENCEYEVIESVEATCTTAGFKTHKCTVCDYTYSDSFVAPYGHTMGNWSTEGKSTHMRSCTECGVMEISKHVWGEYFTNNDGDILEEGSKTRFCIYCAESQTIGKPAAIIENALRTTVSILEFLVKLFGMLKKIFAFFS